MRRQSNSDQGGRRASISFSFAINQVRGYADVPFSPDDIASVAVKQQFVRGLVKSNPLPLPPAIYLVNIKNSHKELHPLGGRLSAGTAGNPETQREAIREKSLHPVDLLDRSECGVR